MIWCITNQPLQWGRSEFIVLSKSRCVDIITLQGNAYLEISKIPFFEGTIHVDVAVVPNNFFLPITPTQNFMVGALAGVLFRKQGVSQYEAYYLRGGAGRLNTPAPTPPISNFGAQYISPPTWIFSNRESKPEYQAGADVAVEQWTTICLAITSQHTYGICR